jgi:hypothetical protein
MKATTGIPSDATPLKCSREYICLTKDGSCEGMTSPEIIKTKSKEEVYNALAEKMADCWWMFGEGKINYVGKDMKENLYCSICSQIMFDNSLTEIEGLEENINEKEYYLYLEDKIMSDSEREETYLKYLTGSNSVKEIEDSLKNAEGSFGSFEYNKIYFLMTGIYSEVGVWQWTLLGVAAGIGVLAVPFTAGQSLWISAIIVGGTGTAGGIAGHYVGTAVKGDGVKNEFLKPVIFPAESDIFNSFNCKDVITTN